MKINVDFIKAELNKKQKEENRLLHEFEAFTRSYNREIYKFFVVCDNYSNFWLRIETPENCFGYSDSIYINSKGEANTHWRYCPNWILKKIQQTVIETGLNYFN